MAYTLWLRPSAHAARKRLPGHMRQRIIRLIDSLGHEPRPPASRALVVTPPPAIPDWEIRRARIDDWRVIYAVNDVLGQIAVMDVRRRPPYEYDDLESLLADLE